MNTQELLFSVWLTNSVKGVKNERGDSPKAQGGLLSPYKVKSVLYLLSDINLYLIVTPNIQQLIE